MKHSKISLLLRERDLSNLTPRESRLNEKNSTAALANAGRPMKFAKNPVLKMKSEEECSLNRYSGALSPDFKKLMNHQNAIPAVDFLTIPHCSGSGWEATEMVIQMSRRQQRPGLASCVGLQPISLSMNSQAYAELSMNDCNDDTLMPGRLGALSGFY